MVHRSIHSLIHRSIDWLIWVWHYSNFVCLFTGRRGDHSANIVATQGGRYDVDLKERKLLAVYWEEEAFPVRRGTWFWKLTGEVYVPYEESIAEKLEVRFVLYCLLLFLACLSRKVLLLAGRVPADLQNGRLAETDRSSWRGDDHSPLGLGHDSLRCHQELDGRCCKLCIFYRHL